MITKLTELNNQKYQETLFKLAGDKLTELDAAGKISDSNLNKVDGKVIITTLEEYFYFLPIILLNIDDNSEKAKYLKLPIDEPYFEIDANSRKIEVPADFKKNGVGVEGDHLAEILFFRINRFFDSKDLGAVHMDIRIQWKTKNHEGLDVAIFKDLDSEPGYVVFGWAVDDKVSEESGNVEFSVIMREQDEKNGSTLYSFNTLATTVMINKALKLSTEPKADDDAGEVINRISESVLAGVPYASTPYFTVDGLGSAYPVDFDTPDGIDEDPNSYKAVASAVPSSDAGIITYDWFYSQIGIGGSDSVALNSSKIENTYIPTKDTNKVEKKVYYTNNGSEYEIYPTTSVFPAPEGVVLYEKVSIATLDLEQGYYWSRAKNTVANKNYRYNNSLPWYVPGPDKITNIGSFPYSSLIVTPEKIETISVIAGIPNSARVMNYEFIKYDNEEAVSAVLDTEETKTLSEHIDIKTLPVGLKVINCIKNFDGTEDDFEGYYTLAVSNTRNKTTTKAKFANSFVRVTKPASMPEFDASVYGPDHRYILSKTESDKLVVKPAAGTIARKDTAKYQWYYLGKLLAEEIEAATRKDFVAIKDANAEEYDPSQAGVYFCEVTYVYNGNSATKDTGYYYVDPQLS